MAASQSSFHPSISESFGGSTKASVSSSEKHGIDRSGGEKQVVVVASDKLRGREEMLV